jgi:NTE family protein
MTMSPAEPRVDAVFEGGGVKGIALIGGAAVIEAAGYQFYNLAGTSAGAIVAALLGAGYTAAELQPILMDLDFTTLLDPATVLSRIPLVGKSLGIFTDLGMYKGDAFLHRMRAWLDAKGVKTFGDLVLPGETETRYRFKVHVVASDVSRGALLMLPDEAPIYGIDPERLEVALAVRMSMSIPYFFKPVMVTNTLGQTCYIVDGGLLSNFPIELFDTPPPAVPAWPTFGFALVSEPADPQAEVRIESPILGPLTLFAALFHTAVVAHDAHAMAVPDVAARTILIDDLGIPPTQFDLTQAQKAALYASGEAAARDFLATWDFDEYKARFRSGAPEVRRQPGLARPSTDRVAQLRRWRGG